MTFQRIATIVFVIAALSWKRDDGLNWTIKVLLGLLALWGAVAWGAAEVP